MLTPFQGSTERAVAVSRGVLHARSWARSSCYSLPGLPAPSAAPLVAPPGCWLSGARSGVAGAVFQGMGRGVHITQLLAQPGFLIIPPHSSNPISTCMQYFIHLKH